MINLPNKINNSFNNLNNVNINYNNINNLNLNSVNGELNYLSNFHFIGNFINLSDFKNIDRSACKKILLVDDEFLIRSTLRRYFEKINKQDQRLMYIVAEANDCFEAFNIIYRSYIDKLMFDYVFIDEFMPIMRGSHLISIFKKLENEKNFYKIKFISYTSFNTAEIINLLYDHGADEVLNKPISFDKFQDFVNRLNSDLD